MNIKKIAPIIVFGIIAILVVALLIVFLPPGQKSTPGSKKAIILASANDYYRKDGEPDFNVGDDANFSSETGNWVGNFSSNGYGAQDSLLPGYNTPGVIQLIVKSPAIPKYVDMEFVYNWTNFFSLFQFAAYNLSAWVNVTTNAWTPAIIIPPGTGARIGLRWLNSSNGVVRTDWSTGIFGLTPGWNFLNVTGIADNSTLNEITQLHLVLAVEGNMTGTDMVLFDDVHVEYWFPPPIPSPPPSNSDTDGFPAQALQVYWVLRNNGYTNDNVFLMLYHKNDTTIDIYANDLTSNDLAEAVVDVEDDNVTAMRFKQELDVLIPGSFASGIQPNDELIIFITDHGSNKVLSDGNATFHFEADDSYITELEFFNLVKQINCARMLINIDMCFSGNFLNENVNIGLSWYNIPNSILITSTTDILSWYWRDNSNPDGFAGSWFFHQFWEQINQSQTVGDAFNYAKNYVPTGQLKSINDIQTPLIQDNLGIKDSWLLV
ncbi:MAG: C13 family peptidase [Promethearchaeota archaeon]|jgi:hypothetical protein